MPKIHPPRSFLPRHVSLMQAGWLLSSMMSLCLLSPSVMAQTGPVAAYNFNEGSGQTVLDDSGNNNHGLRGSTASTESRDPAWTTLGKYGGALAFDGSNDWMTVTDAPSLDLTTAMTLEAWVYPTASQGGWRTILQKQVDAYFLHASGGGTLVPAGGGTFNGDVDYLTASSAIPVNVWTHLALTYDGATLRFYVNGVQVATRIRTGVLETSANPLRLGGNSPYGEYFKGRIDEVRIYDRALSQAEIQTDMSAPIAPPILHHLPSP